MDAMVTARMPQGKKDAGNAILRQLGTSASQVINELYDYIILMRATPFGSTQVVFDEDAMRDAIEYVDGMPKVELEKDWLSADARDSKRSRLATLVADDLEASR